MPGSILTIGEILVEIMATTPGEGFGEPVDLVGPFPSGAPAIFIDQAGRLGHRCAMIGCVGDDDFGRLNVDRLRRDGVDVGAIAVDADAVTGSAFVRYRRDGRRDFVFNIRHSANGRLSLGTEARAALERAGHLHVVGSSLSVPAIAEAIVAGVASVKQRGGTVSFDPNMRKEVMGSAALLTIMRSILRQADIFLPSGDELTALVDARDGDDAMRQILALGVTAVVHKMGATGARYVDRASDVFVPGFPVAELDPTGAGDIFGATFVAGWLERRAPAEALLRAAAAGAIAVTRRGPMEGVSSSDEIDRFLRRL